jgi:replicative DNA helicase
VPPGSGGQPAPYSQEAEEAVIGATLVNPEMFLNVAAFLHAEDFYILRHGYIWEAMNRLDERREAIDFVTLQEELRAMHRLNDVGGPAYLLHLINSTPTSIHAEIYGHLVLRAAIRRRLLVAADEIKVLAQDEQLAIEKVIDDANARLYQATETRQTEADPRAASLIREYWDELEAKVTGDVAGGIPTGFRDLDAFSGGTFRREVTVLAAPPGFGKTTLLLNIAHNALRLNQRVAFFSVEMGRKEAIQRFVSMEIGVPTARLKAGSLIRNDKRDEWALFVEASGRIGTWPLYIVDTKRLTPLQAQRRLRRLQHDYGVDLVLIDGLWKMVSHRKFESGDRRHELTSIMEDLVALAEQTNLPIVITHQLSRESVKRVKGKLRRPQLSDLSDSTGIEQNAHVIWGMYRENYPDNRFGSDKTEVITLKARDGFYGTATLGYEKSHSRYVDEPVRVI